MFISFHVEVLAPLAVASVAVVVVRPRSVEVGTKRAFKFIKDTHKPCIVVVNKMDKDNADPNKTFDSLQELFNGNPQRLMREFGVKINYPLYLHNLLLSNLHENIKLGFTEQYCKELFMEIKEKVK